MQNKINFQSKQENITVVFWVFFFFNVSQGIKDKK